MSGVASDRKPNSNWFKEQRGVTGLLNLKVLSLTDFRLVD